jgi:hypothetical protein
MCPGSQLIECLPQPTDDFVSADPLWNPTLHGSNDCRGTKPPGKVYDRSDKIPRQHPPMGIRVRQGEFAPNPSRSGSHGGKLESVFSQEVPKLQAVEVISMRGEQFDRVKAQGCRPGQSGIQRLVKHKRPLARLWNQANGNGGPHRHGRRMPEWAAEASREIDKRRAIPPTQGLVSSFYAF